MTRRVRSAAGFTFVELFTAIALSAVVLGLIFGTWTAISRHVFVNRRRAELAVSADRIAQTLVTELRRSREVLRWERHSIVFVPDREGDTVTVSYDGERLYRQGVPVHLGVRGTRVVQFELVNATGRDQVEQPQKLLRLQLTLESPAGERVGVSLETNVHAPHRDFGGGWNF
jgi:type II secretory pathway component PulJ